MMDWIKLICTITVAFSVMALVAYGLAYLAGDAG